MKFLKQRKLDKLCKKRDKLETELKFCTNEAKKSALTGELNTLKPEIDALKFELEHPDMKMN